MTGGLDALGWGYCAVDGTPLASGPNSTGATTALPCPACGSKSISLSPDVDILAVTRFAKELATALVMFKNACDYGIVPDTGSVAYRRAEAAIRSLPHGWFADAMGYPPDQGGES